MIKHFRVDERLIHGQVATVWVNSLGCNRIIVANNEALQSEMQISALKLACPTAVKLSILSVEKAAININDGKYDGDTVFLITKNIKDCKKLLDLGLKIGSVNVGNQAHKEGQTKIKNSVSLSAEDIAVCRDIIASGVKVTAQMLPNETDASIETYFKSNNV